MSKTLKVTEGDVVRNVSTGQYTMIEEKAKIEQDVKMNLSTNIRRIINIGCSLDEAVGEDQNEPASAFSFAPVMFDFQMLVRGGMERLRRAQRTYLFSQRTATELIYEFTPVDFRQDIDDPRVVRWKMEVKTVNGIGNFALTGKFKN